ncbi:hypothetical protein KS4_30410 [Poriferisphaera corsica]|uniref:Uncharacterized protein n=1 Tax=Poriferisphaera corsica TaxID=2528020 RepID=A0A517YXM2_9BACT|nr:hypothetical protein [Poriferisphaera corsica]QDU34964.1 hypothetical protein KS4_30410 [Poriferisphaera corsica]
MRLNLILVIILIAFAGAGCTTSHGIAKNDVKFTQVMAENKTSIGLVSYSVAHDGNYEEKQMLQANARTAEQNGVIGLLVGMGVEATMKWNIPTEEQRHAVRILDEKVRRQLVSNLGIEVPPLLTYQAIAPAKGLHQRKKIKYAITGHRLASGLVVDFSFTQKYVSMFDYESVVRGKWTIYDTDGKAKLVIHTENMLPEMHRVEDTREIEHHTYYLNTIREATEDFAIFLYEALQEQKE